MEPLEPRIAVILEEREVQLRAWRYLVHGLAGHVPIYFLETALPENSPGIRLSQIFSMGEMTITVFARRPF